MANPFVKVQVIINHIVIAVFTLIVIVGNLVYGGSVKSWGNSIVLLLVLTAALIIKNRKIKSSDMDLDERLELITYRAISIGFYFMLGALFWFFIKDMIITGQVPVRIVIVLLTGLAGYLGGFYVLYKRY